MTRDWDKNADHLRIRKVCAVGVLVILPSIARILNIRQAKCFIWNERKITVHSMMKLLTSTPTSRLTFATRMTKRKGKNALARERNTSTHMNQVDTSPLRDLRTAGWTFVRLVVVDELVSFRILQLHVSLYILWHVSFACL